MTGTAQEAQVQTMKSSTTQVDFQILNLQPVVFPIDVTGQVRQEEVVTGQVRQGHHVIGYNSQGEAVTG